MKKALIVEDFLPIAEIWNILLCNEGYESIEIINNTDDVEEAVARLIPDIIFMDINLPGKMNGLEITKHLISLNPTYKILIITMHSNPKILKVALENGAKGFVVKNSPISELRNAIATIELGEIYVCTDMRQHLN